MKHSLTKKNFYIQFIFNTGLLIIRYYKYKICTDRMEDFRSKLKRVKDISR